MTRMQRDPSNSFIAGSFNDDHSYALTPALGGQDSLVPKPYDKVTPNVLGFHDAMQTRQASVDATVSVLNAIAEELQHASEMSNSESLSRSYHSDVSTVRVEVSILVDKCFKNV